MPVLKGQPQSSCQYSKANHNLLVSTQRPTTVFLSVLKGQPQCSCVVNALTATRRADHILCVRVKYKYLLRAVYLVSKIQPHPTKEKRVQIKPQIIYAQGPTALTTAGYNRCRRSQLHGSALQSVLVVTY